MDGVLYYIPLSGARWNSFFHYYYSLIHFPHSFVLPAETSNSVDPVAPSLHDAIPPRVKRVLNTSSLSWSHHTTQPSSARLFSTSRCRASKDDSRAKATSPKLTHVSESGAAHMVSIAKKEVTSRIAIAACTVHFSDATALKLIRDNQMKKGDVLGIARIAGIMAAKRTPDLIPLCHPVPVSHVSVDLRPTQEGSGAESIEIRATVECDGKTGVEMEALTAASTAALTVYDMCKAVDKGMIVDGLRVVLKDGGKSGRWEMK